jgi:hypothetical protein
MSDLFEQLTTHFTKKQIGHWSNPNELALCVDFPSIVGFYRVYAKIDIEDGRFHACGQTRLSVPDECCAAVVEMLALANGRQLNSEVELDQVKSELKFCVSEKFEGDELSGEMIDRLFSAARSGVDTFLRASLFVIFGDVQPAAALRQALSKQRT